AAVIVRGGQRAAQRGAVGIAGAMEVAAERDHGEVGATPVGARSSLSERRQRAQDEPWIARVQDVPAEVARGEPSGRVALHNDVGPLGETEEEVAAGGTLEGEREPSLRAVGG